MDKYNKFFDLAYKKALHLTNDTYIAEDIASEVIYLFVLKKETIPEEDKIKWIIGRVKNHCKRHFTMQKREKKIQEKVQTKKIIEEELSKASDSENNEKVNFFYKSYVDTLKHFTEAEKKLINTFLQNQMDVRKTSEVLERPYSEIQKKIYRIKGEIKAKGYLDFGYIATKKIISPSLTDSIYRFLNKLTKAVENNSYKSLNNYFLDINTKELDLNLHIKKVMDYDVLLKNRLYEILIIFVSKSGKVESVEFKFKVKQGNWIRIIGQPKKKSVYKFSSITKEAQELKHLLQTKKDKQGLLPIPNEVFDKYIETYKQQHKDEEVNED